MTQQLLDISPWQLAVCMVFVLTSAGASLALRLGLGKDLVVGTVRAVSQLFLMGYVLKFIFALNMPAPTLGIFLVMMVTAAWIIGGRIKQKVIPVRMPVFLSMLLTYSVTSYLVVGVVVGADPWWMPQYFIPLSGMIVGNSMNAIAIALERLFSDLKTRRNEVEMRLSLGATAREASRDILAGAVRAGMIPSINSLMGVGLVFLPGMMTGQILTGADPVSAIKYQIVVMLMLVASTAMGSLLTATLVRNRCFGPAHQLLLR